MTLLRQSITGLAIALISVALLWLTWLTGLSENLFAASDRNHADCEYPAGWAVYSLQTEDDLAQWAAQAGYSLEEIMASNCLPADANLPVGDRLYLPIEILEFIDPSCGPPDGWGYYLTHEGDGFNALADSFGIQVDQLRLANCFLNDSDFEPGMRIYAPASALVTPTLSPSATPSITVDSGTEASPTVEP